MPDTMSLNATSEKPSKSSVCIFGVIITFLTILLKMYISDKMDALAQLSTTFDKTERSAHRMDCGFVSTRCYLFKKGDKCRECHKSARISFQDDLRIPNNKPVSISNNFYCIDRCVENQNVGQEPMIESIDFRAVFTCAQTEKCAILNRHKAFQRNLKYLYPWVLRMSRKGQH